MEDSTGLLIFVYRHDMSFLSLVFWLSIVEGLLNPRLLIKHLFDPSIYSIELNHMPLVIFFTLILYL